MFGRDTKITRLGGLVQHPVVLSNADLVLVAAFSDTIELFLED